MHARNQTDEATDVDADGQSGVGSAYMRIESLGNGNHLEAKSPRRRTDGRTRTDADGAEGDADAVHDSALVSAVVAVADAADGARRSLMAD